MEYTLYSKGKMFSVLNDLHFQTKQDGWFDVQNNLIFTVKAIWKVYFVTDLVQQKQHGWNVITCSCSIHITLVLTEHCMQLLQPCHTPMEFFLQIIYSEVGLHSIYRYWINWRQTNIGKWLNYAFSLISLFLIFNFKQLFCLYYIFSYGSKILKGREEIQ